MNRLILETVNTSMPPITYQHTISDKIQKIVIGFASLFILSQIIILLVKAV